MDQDYAKNKQLLEKYLVDKSKRSLPRSDGDYEFVDRVADTPDEVRVYTTFFRTLGDGEIIMYRHVTKNQKFLCVNGPLAGQRVTEDSATDYAVFNRAGNRYSEDTIARVILVHVPSLTLK